MRPPVCGMRRGCNKKTICWATLRRLCTSPNTIPRTANDPRCSIHRSRPVQLAQAPTHLLHSRRRGTEGKRKRAENASADAGLVLACVPLRLTRPGIRLVVPSLHFTEMVVSSTVDPAMPCSLRFRWMPRRSFQRCGPHATGRFNQGFVRMPCLTIISSLGVQVLSLPVGQEGGGCP